MRRTEKRRNSGVEAGMELSAEGGQEMQQGSRVTWGVTGRRTTGRKGTGTETATEDGNVEKEERAGRARLFKQRPCFLLPVIPPRYPLQRNPNPWWAWLRLEQDWKSPLRLVLLTEAAGQEHTRHLLTDRVRYGKVLTCT